jgi:hypothetical protein
LQALRTLTSQDIKATLDGVLAAEKAAGNSATAMLGPAKDIKTPEYYDGYRLAIEQRNRIRAHADTDYFPADLFKLRAPSQTEEETAYIKANYKCTTNPVWSDFVQTAGRALIDSNWAIKYPAELEEFRDYVQSGVDTFGSVESFVKTILVELKIYDPNGIIAVRPKRFDTVTVTDEEGKQIEVLDDLQPLKPVPMYYGCDKVVAREAGHWYMVLTTERSMVEYAGKMQRVGRVFEVYDDTYVWRVEQIEKATDNKFEIYPWYAHGWGKVPATELKGTPKIKPDGSIFWQSPFYPAVGLLDLCLTNRNIIQSPISRMMFPMPVMEGDECDFEDDEYRCHGGKLHGEGAKNGKTCPACHGTGTKHRISPFGAYLYKRPSALEGERAAASNPLTYVSPPTDSSRFVLDVVKEDEQKARDLLHLKPTSAMTNGTTATEVSKDNKAMYAFILPISNQIFDLYQFILDATEYQFTGEADAPRVELTYPSAFDFKTESDYLEELKFAREAGAPDVVIHALVYRLLSNMFFTEGETAKAFEILVLADRLMAMSPEVVSLRKSQGSITDAELLIHDSGLTLINQLMMADPDWIEKPIDEQLEDLRNLAAERAPERTDDALVRLALGS